MAKKRKSKVKPAEAGAPQAAATAPSKVPQSDLIWEVLRHPTLVLAWVTLGLTVVAIVATLRFHRDMSVGAIREPTGIILLAAVTITLFASYWRQRVRDRRLGK